MLSSASPARRTFDLHTLAGISLFCAMYTALSFVSINLSAVLRISFSFLALAASCFFYGLWPNVLMAFACDFLGWAVHPDGAYMPLFALVIIAKAVIYSLFFYRMEKISLWRVLAAQLCTTVLCSLLLNPLILSMMYGTPFSVLFTARLAKNALLYPVECFLLYLTLRVCIRLRRNTSLFPGGRH